MTPRTNGLAKRLAAEAADQLANNREQVETAGAGWTSADERAYARTIIQQLLGDEARRRLETAEDPLDPDAESEVAEEALARLFGLGRLQRYLDDPRVTDIQVQGCDVVWVKHIDGSRRQVDPVADSDAELIELLRLVAARMGRSERRFDAANPELNLQLPDGSRLLAVMEVSARPLVVIRKHQFELAFLSDLQQRGTVDAPLAAFLRAAVLARRSIVIAGDIGSGKTTLMRALINEIPPLERLVTIEDPLELGIDRFPELHPNGVSLEARPANIEGRGEISLEALVRMGLRMDPDRVFVGEVRGSELLPMLLAMSQGQDGSMCTVHARSAQEVFGRFQMFGVLSEHPLAPADTALLAANAVDFVVHLGKRGDRDDQVHRYVTSVLEVRGADGREVVTNEVFRPGRDGRAVPTGALSAERLADLEEAGLDRRLLTPAGEVNTWP